MIKLTIELVPRTCWCSNVRDHVSKETWDALRKETYQNARYHCEICGERGTKHPVECHETWHYDDENKVQTLTGLVALCPSCHEAKHIGWAEFNGKSQRAKTHLGRINQWSESQVEAYITSTFSQWRQRSIYKWTLDLKFLESRGISIQSKR